MTNQAIGDVKGFMRRLGIHRRRTFTLYPLIGGPVVCRFGDIPLDRVVAAFGRSVSASGVLYYRPGLSFPHRADITAITVHPPDDELPTLASLRGILRPDD